MCGLLTAHISFCDHEIIELCTPAFITNEPCPLSLMTIIIWPLVGWCSFCISETGSEEEEARLAVLAEEEDRRFYGEGEGSIGSGDDDCSSGYSSSGDSSSSESDGEDECGCLKW